MQDIILKNAVFTALDLETSGLSPEKAEILEVGMVKFSLDSDISTYQSYLKPLKPLDRRAQEINGITADMVKNAPDARLILQEIAEYINNTILVIHNSWFDISFLIYYADKYNITLPNMPVYCTLTLARQAWPEFERHNLDSLRVKLSIKKTPPARPGYHEAVDDSYAARDVFRKGIERLELADKRCLEGIKNSKNLYLVSDYKRK